MSNWREISTDIQGLNAKITSAVAVQEKKKEGPPPTTPSTPSSTISTLQPQCPQTHPLSASPSHSLHSFPTDEL